MSAGVFSNFNPNKTEIFEGSWIFPPSPASYFKQKIWLKLMKIANIKREILHIFLTTWGISIKFSAQMWLMIISKARKNQGFILSLEDFFKNIFQKTIRGGAQIDIPPPLPHPLSRFRVKLFCDVLTTLLCCTFFLFLHHIQDLNLFIQGKVPFRKFSSSSFLQAIDLIVINCNKTHFLPWFHLFNTQRC